jgi:Peptidase M50B-like
MTAPPLETVVHRIVELQAPLPAATSLLIGVAALGAVTLSATWVMLRHVSLIAHEGAHALMGSSLGHRVRGVILLRSGGGETLLPTIQNRGSGIPTGLIGYLGPSLFGLGAAKLIAVGHIVAVLWLALLALAVLFPLLRTTFGVISVILTGGLIYIVARYATVGAQEAVAYGIAWFLLLAAIKVVRLRGSDASDADVLNRLTLLPRGFWSSAWLAGTLIALVVGGSLLT